MRIIAGRFRSRILKPVPGTNVRPTPDRLREAMFSVLMPRIQGSVFLDAYAGTGAVGIEAVSRGAKHAILIEKRSDALGVIRENLRSLQLTDEVTLVRGSAAGVLSQHPCDIAFIDPPYELVKEYGTALEALERTPCSLAIAQHASRFQLQDVYGAWRRQRVLRQGDNSLSFYERA